MRRGRRCHGRVERTSCSGLRNRVPTGNASRSPRCPTGDPPRSTTVAAYWWSGASASGVQIADELQRAGRDVTIAVGEHVRLPRSYRGCDIYWWLDRIGQLDERWNEVEDLQRARRHASVQVVGSDDRREVDLASLQGLGVQLVGRLMAIRGTTALCSGGLGSLVANADLKQARLLHRIDEWVDEHDMAGLVGPAIEPAPDRSSPTYRPSSTWAASER